MATTDEIVARAKARARAKAVLSGRPTQPPSFSLTPTGNELLPSAPGTAPGNTFVPAPEPEIDKAAIVADVVRHLATARQIPFARENRTGIEDVAAGLVRGSPIALQGVGSAMQVPDALLQQIGGSPMTAGLSEMGRSLEKAGSKAAAFLPEPNTIAGQVAQGVTPMAAGIGAAALTGGVGGLAAFAGTVGAPVVGQVFDQGKKFHEAQGDQDAEAKAALEAMVAGGIVTAAQVPAIAIMSRVPGGIQAIQNGVLRAAAKFGWGAVAGGVPGALQEVALSAQSDLQRGDPNAYEGLGTRAVVSGATGAVMGGLGTALSKGPIVDRRTVRDIAKEPPEFQAPTTAPELGSLGEPGVVPRATVKLADASKPTPLPPAARPAPRGSATPGGDAFPSESSIPTIVPNPKGIVEPAATAPSPVSGFNEFFSESTIPAPTGPKGILGDMLSTEPAPPIGSPGTGGPPKPPKYAQGREPYRTPLEPEPAMAPRPKIEPPVKSAPPETAPLPAETPGLTRAKNFAEWVAAPFRPRGNKPKFIWQANLARSAETRSQLDRFNMLSKDYRKASKAAGFKQTPENIAKVNQFVRGGDGADLPDAVRTPLASMREIVDGLSSRVVGEGLADGPLAVTIEANKGAYITRAYRAEIDRGWTPEKTVIARGRSYIDQQLREANPTADPATLVPERERLLQGTIDFFRNLDGGRGKSRLGEKDLGIFKKRGEIAPEIRALWGEVDDPVAALSITNYRLAHLLENHKFLTRIREHGEGKVFWRPDDPNRPATATATFASEGSESMSPLNGMMATPELVKALQTRGNPVWDHPALRTIYALNTATKISKTAGNFPRGHIRNFVSRPAIVVAQGLNPLSVADGIKLIYGAGKPGAMREFLLDMERRGVLSTSGHSGELEAGINAAFGGMTEGANVLNKPRSLAEKALKAPENTMRAAVRLYKYGDDVWTAGQVIAELARYKAAYEKAGIPITEDALRQMAADATIATAPMYERLPPIVRTVSARVPVVGAFTSWPTAMFRSVIGQGLLIRRELANPVTRGIAAQRIAGGLTAATAVPALLSWWNARDGVTHEQNKAVRRMLPDWSKNSELKLSPNDDGTWDVWDVSWSDPHSIFKDTIIAAARGLEDSGIIGAAMGALTELAGPFTDEQLLAGAVNDIINNPDQKVYNPTEPWTKQAQDIAARVWEAFEPGTISDARRAYKGFTGTKDYRGRAFDGPQEIQSILTGFRPMRMDPKLWLEWRAGKYGADQQLAERRVRRIQTTRADPSESQISEAAAVSEESRRGVFDEMVKDIEAARSLGLTDQEIGTILNRSGVSRRDIMSLLSNTYVPYTPSPQTIRNSMSRNAAVGVEADPAAVARQIQQEQKR